MKLHELMSEVLRRGLELTPANLKAVHDELEG